jgi:hypothetical protein
MTALLAESYSRAYVSFITAQQLSELEEIIEYKQLLKQTGVLKSLSSEKNGEDDVEAISIATAGQSSSSGLYRMRNGPGAFLCLFIS